MVTTALALHPSAQRRLTEGMAHPPAHDVILRPLGGGGLTAMIATAQEQAFIAAVLNDLKRPDWRQAIAARQGVRRGSDGLLELQQPIHRRFHLALFEAVCRTPGSPRLDPKKIDGMGLVLRRDAGAPAPGRVRLRQPPQSGLQRVGTTHDGWDGWMSDGPIRRGWLTIAAEDLDPDPSAQNTPRPASAQQTLQALIAQKSGAARRLTEEVLPLFAASPDVCQAVGSTVLYGLVPVASPEQSDAPPPPPNYAADPDAAAMRQHFASYLKARAGQAMPNAGQTLDPAWKPLQNPADGDSNAARLYNVGLFLQQMTVELAAFDDTPSAQHLMSLLGKIRLPLAKDIQGVVTADTSAADFARVAAPILVSNQANSTGAIMPLEWPAVDATLGGQLSDACLACLADRFAALSPKLPKFYGDSTRYAIRGFIRVQHDPACPPELIWSDYSERFRIVPWWDSDGPAARISMPGVGSLKNLKPNVSFEVPSDLATLLQGDPTKLAQGQGSTTPDLGIMWLCSFSLPAITICAYIVLSIFIGLLNLVFWWSAWIKICIPIPRPK